VTASHTLVADGATLGYGDRIVADAIDLAVPPGRITVIVGANACGKSTLLKAMARLVQPRSGRIVLDGEDLHRMPTKAVARTLGLLPQSPSAPEGIAVADLVARGRHPHQGFLSRWSAEDAETVAEALRLTDTAGLADRAVDELSGGQRQRTWIAMALAQQTDVLLLDEPTTFLDISHQVEVLDLLTDLNLAARYADHLVAVAGGRVHAAGDPGDVLTADTVREVFGLESRVVPDPVSGRPMVLPIGRHHVLAPRS
jgi:iron complex transport system ATP-binding protein